MPRTEGRESSSRRSRSGRRSRRHRSHHRHVSSGSRSRSRFRNKYKEKNFLAAVCSMIAIVVMCSAMAEPKWISFQGGGCKIDGKPLYRLGVNQFFYPGKFNTKTNSFVNAALIHDSYQFGPKITDRMDNCVTYKAVLLLKTMISFSFLAIFCSLGAFILDLLGPKQRALKLLRRNGILNIVTVILTVVIDLFCYWLTTEVQTLQEKTHLKPGSKVYVDFDISFYLVTAAGCISVIATAFNCLRRYPLYEDHQGESLLDDYDDGHAGQVGSDAMFLPPPPLPPPSAGQDVSQMSNLPPPPAYTP